MRSKVSSAMKATSTQSNVARNLSSMPFSLVTIWGNFSRTRPPPEILGVVHDGLEAEDALAFGISLQGQGAEVHLEHRQVIRRFLDHDRQQRRGTLLPISVGTCVGAEQGPELRHIQARPGPVDHALEDLILCPPTWKTRLRLYSAW